MSRVVYLVEEEVSCRLDLFLALTIDITRSQVKKLVQEGCILVDEMPAFKAGILVKKGQLISVDFPQNTSQILPQNLPIDIVYEDEFLAVINKPQDMVVHPAGRLCEGTLVNALLYRFNSLSSLNGDIRPGIVHRLDKDTSGLLVVAKTDKAHAHLANQIFLRTATRKYLGLCEGVVAKDSLVIETNIGRDSKDRKKMAVVANGGKHAITNVLVKKRYAQHTLCEFKLQTGRTHQIRVHAKHIGHPIVGDCTYGIAKQKFELKGQLLHSYFLSFTHPITSQTMSFESELPTYFSDVLARLK